MPPEQIESLFESGQPLLQLCRFNGHGHPSSFPFISRPVPARKVVSAPV